MAGELEQVAAATGLPAEKLADHFLRQQTNAAAMAEPLPGAVRDAFAPMQDIEVGPYKVRPCYDGDIEYLSLFDHPLHEMRLRAQAAGSGEIENLYQPQGPMAWELCYLFTHSLDEIDALVEEGGLDALRKEAKKEFSRKRLAALVAISEAAIQQYGLYWQPVLSYGASESGDGDAESVKKKSLAAAKSSMTASAS